MDNKQDRQLYWEVKDFLTRKNQNNVPAVKTDTLKEAIQKTISQNSYLYEEKTSNKKTLSNDLVNSVNSLLSMNENAIKKATPDSIGLSPNITTNLFNIQSNKNTKISLNEAIAQTLAPAMALARVIPSYARRPEDEQVAPTGEPDMMPGAKPGMQAPEPGTPAGGPAGGLGGSSTRFDKSPAGSKGTKPLVDTYPTSKPLTPEQQMKREEHMQELERQRAEKAERSKQRDQDKLDAIKKELGQSGVTVDDKNEAAKNAKTAEEYLTAVGAQAREKLRSHRAEKSDENIANRAIETYKKYAGRDPSTLSEKELRELAGAQLSVHGYGEDGNKPIPGRQSIADRIKTLLKPKKVLETEPTAETPEKQMEKDAAAIEAAKATGYSPEEEQKKEAALKLMQDKSFVSRHQQMSGARIAKEDAEKKANTVISGTTMTMAQFKAMTGEDYNAMNRQHQNLVRAAASTDPSMRYSPEGLETMKTAYQFNKRYDQQHAENAAKMGNLERTYDEHQFEYHKFKTDPEYRAKVLAAERAPVEKKAREIVAAEEARRAQLQAQGIAQAKSDIAAGKSAPTLARYPDKEALAAVTPKPAPTKPAEDFVTRKPEEENIIPYRSPEAAAAGRADARNLQRAADERANQARLDRERELANQTKMMAPSQRRLIQPGGKLTDADTEGTTPATVPAPTQPAKQEMTPEMQSAMDRLDRILKGTKSSPSPLADFTGNLEAQQRMQRGGAPAIQPGSGRSLINSFTAPGVKEKPEAGSEEDIEDQLRRLRGQ